QGGEQEGHAPDRRQVPRVPLHRRRPGDRREEPLPAAQGGARRAVPQARPLHHRRRLRRLGRGAEDPLRRRWHLRSDLSKEVMSRRSALPGFGISFGTTVAVLGLVVLLPLAMLAVKSAELGLGDIARLATTPRALAAYGLTFGASFAAALVDTVFGIAIAYVLVRYEFPGKSLLDAFVDVPFAVPTAVSGIALTTLYAPGGWVGRVAGVFGVQIAYTRLGVAVALVFVSLPFAVRTIQPVLAELEPEMEESAATLGAGRLVTFVRVILPNLVPPPLT